MRLIRLLLLLVSFTAVAELPRRAQAGLGLVADEGRVVVRDAFPGRAGDRAGLKAGDVILSFDGERVSTPGDVISRFAKKKVGETARIEYQRGEEARFVDMTMLEWPRETGEAYEVTYGEVTADGNRYRTLRTKPKNAAPVATLFLVQGVGCGSVDNPPPTHSYRLMIESLSRRGFATLRVDKPGTGDSEGGPCAQADYTTEVNAYRAALASLKDEKNVFLFGHSMGGIMAPVIATAAPLRGIAVYGTTYRSWLQYTLDNYRRQARMRGEPFEEIAGVERATERFNALFYTLDWPMEKILSEYPEYREVFPDGLYAAGKAGKYFQQMYDVELTKAWKATSSPVLVLYGGSDFLTEEREHQLIAEAVNSWRPNTATYRRLDGIDHWLNKAADGPASLNQQNDDTPEQYNDRLAESLATFMTEHSK